MNIYLVEDNPLKAVWIDLVIELLNRKGGGSDSYADGFGGQVADSHYNPQRLWQAVNDSDGVCLIDVELPLELHQVARDSLKKMVIGQYSADRVSRVDSLYKEYQGIFDKRADWDLAALLLALCRANGVPCLTVTSVMDQLRGYKLSRKGIQNAILGGSRENPPNEDECGDLVNKLYWLCILKDKSTTDSFLCRMEQLDPHFKSSDFETAVKLLSDSLNLGDQFDRIFRKKDCQPRDDIVLSEALKSISGIPDTRKGLPTGSRPLSLSGAWLLALVQFRSKLPHENWLDVFSPHELEQGSRDADGRFPAVHNFQGSPEIRRVTIQRYIRSCEVLFEDRAHKDSVNPCSSLKRVSLLPKELTFSLKFPALELMRNMQDQVRAARSEKVAYEANHDCSNALWELWLSVAFSDIEAAGNGVFPGKVRVDVVGTADDLTEVRFVVS